MCRNCPPLRLTNFLRIHRNFLLETQGLVTLARCGAALCLDPGRPSLVRSRSRLALHSFFEACIGSSKHALATGSSRPFYRNRESPLIKCLRRVRAIRSNSSHPRVRKQVAQQPNLQGSVLDADHQPGPDSAGPDCMPNDRAGAKRSWRCGCQISLPPAHWTWSELPPGPDRPALQAPIRLLGETIAVLRMGSSTRPR